jgi:ketosteroid isomerase-like protein
MQNKTRTTKEVFDHHLEAFGKRDLEAIKADFSSDAVYINSAGVVAKGPDEIIEVYRQYFDSQEPGASGNITQLIIEGDIVFLEWVANSRSINIPDGVDTFVIQNGMIKAQTAKFTVVTL